MLSASRSIRARLPQVISRYSSEDFHWAPPPAESKPESGRKESKKPTKSPTAPRRHRQTEAHRGTSNHPTAPSAPQASLEENPDRPTQDQAGESREERARETPVSLRPEVGTRSKIPPSSNIPREPIFVGWARGPLPPAGDPGGSTAVPPP